MTVMVSTYLRSVALNFARSSGGGHVQCWTHRLQRWHIGDMWQVVNTFHRLDGVGLHLALSDSLIFITTPRPGCPCCTRRRRSSLQFPRIRGTWTGRLRRS